MCMEDVRLGRRKKVRGAGITLTTGLGVEPMQIIRPDANRTHLRVTAQGSTVYLYTPCPGQGNVIFALLQGTVNFVDLDVEEYGQLVMGPIYATGVGAPFGISYIEAYLEDQ